MTGNEARLIPDVLQPLLAFPPWPSCHLHTDTQQTLTLLLWDPQSGRKQSDTITCSQVNGLWCASCKNLLSKLKSTLLQGQPSPKSLSQWRNFYSVKLDQQGIFRPRGLLWTLLGSYKSPSLPLRLPLATFTCQISKTTHVF